MCSWCYGIKSFWCPVKASLQSLEVSWPPMKKTCKDSKGPSISNVLIPIYLFFSWAKPLTQQRSRKQLDTALEVAVSLRCAVGLNTIPTTNIVILPLFQKQARLSMAKTTQTSMQHDAISDKSHWIPLIFTMKNAKQNFQTLGKVHHGELFFSSAVSPKSEGEGPLFLNGPRCIGSVAGGSVGLVGGSLLGHFSPRGGEFVQKHWQWMSMEI